MHVFVLSKCVELSSGLFFWGLGLRVYRFGFRVQG